jgi:hypothetical protein
MNRDLNIAEAKAWLSGERSMINTIMGVEANVKHRPETLAFVERADTAMVERAYWVLRAYAEELL